MYLVRSTSIKTLRSACHHLLERQCSLFQSDEDGVFLLTKADKAENVVVVAALDGDGEIAVEGAEVGGIKEFI